jgi:hypothetical protein
MYKYLAEIKEIKDAEPYSKQYQVFHATCPFCGYKCEVHAVDTLGVEGIYQKCHVCKKSLVKRDKKFVLR